MKWEIGEILKTVLFYCAVKTYCAVDNTLQGMELKMKKNKKNLSEYKENAATKARALERESNITLVSTSVAIVSFFLMLYIHNAVTTNFVAATGMITVIEILFLVAAVACAVVAIWKKKTFLWEYVAFCLIMAIGYHLIPGVSGIPGMVSEGDGTFTVRPIAVKLSTIITTKNVIYGLWAVNVLYCVLTIVLHSVKYTKIKKGSKN